MEKGSPRVRKKEGIPRRGNSLLKSKRTRNGWSTGGFGGGGLGVGGGVSNTRRTGSDREVRALVSQLRTLDF